MKIVYISNFINHHQIGVAEELFALTGGQYRFLETEKMPESFKKSGYPDYSHRPFVVRMWEDKSQYNEGKRLCINSDVVIFGGNELAFKLAKERVNIGKFTIEYSERWLKKGILNLLSPRLINETISYWVGKWWKKPIYRICLSAYAANDLYFLRQYKNRCFKWAYFTKVDTHRIQKQRFDTSPPIITIMWCARFLDWKHPELPVLLASRLKEKGYNFRIDMYGNGELLSKIKSLIEKKRVGDVVCLCGNKPNSEILDEMSKHDLFLFTSDRHEGWGAVLNEAMSNGCVPVAANDIGSVPFLIEDGVNGMIFNSKKIDSLENKVKHLLDNPNIIDSMSSKAMETMQLWSPKVAARRLIELIDRLRNGKNTPYEIGPCSKATPM